MDPGPSPADDRAMGTGFVVVISLCVAVPLGVMGLLVERFVSKL